MRSFRPLISFLPRRAEDNAPATLYALIRALGARVTKTAVDEAMREHPDAGSLLAMSDALNAWQIDNTALQLASVEQFRELPTPFVAHLHERKGWFALVSSVRSDGLTWFDMGQGWRTESLAEFGKRWSGAVLLAEASEKSGQTDYSQNRTKERLQTARQVLLVAGGILLLTLSLYRVADYATPAVWELVLTKILGTVASLLLLVSLFDRQNPMVTRLCQISKKTDCQTVLDAPAAKLWGWLSWAEIGAFYFAGGLLTLVLTTHPAATLTMLAALSALALPYTLFSVYYQWQVAKTWCVLCLVVQGLLVAEFFLTLTQWPLTLPGSIAPVLPKWLVGFGLPVLGYALVKPWLTSRFKFRDVQGQLRRFKNDPTLFQTLLHKQPAFATPPPASSMSLGNPDAPHTITMVTNPYCDPCVKAHEQLEQLIRQTPNVNAQIVFLAYDGPEGRIHTASRHLLALHGENPARAAEALNAWYGQDKKEYGSWAAAFPATVELARYGAITGEHYDWCRRIGVNATPTLYLNGYPLQEPYRVEDLRWLVSGLETVQHPVKA